MPRGKRLRGVSSKEQRQYEHIKESAQKSGRYGRRQGGRGSDGDEAAPGEKVTLPAAEPAPDGDDAVSPQSITRLDPVLSEALGDTPQGMDPDTAHGTGPSRLAKTPSR